MLAFVWELRKHRHTQEARGRGGGAQCRSKRGTHRDTAAAAAKAQYAARAGGRRGDSAVRAVVRARHGRVSCAVWQGGQEVAVGQAQVVLQDG